MADLPDWYIDSMAEGTGPTSTLAKEVIRLRQELYFAQSEVEHLNKIIGVCGRVSMGLMKAAMKQQQQLKKMKVKTSRATDARP